MGEFLNARRISNVPHGLNHYQDFKNIVFLSALNPSPAFINFLEKHEGIDLDDIRDAMVHQRIYQALMRTALRDQNSTEPVQIIVPDRKSGEWINEVFKGSTVEQVHDPMVIKRKKIGRPCIGKQPMTNTERSRRRRERIRKFGPEKYTHKRADQDSAEAA